MAQEMLSQLVGTTMLVATDIVLVMFVSFKYNSAMLEWMQMGTILPHWLQLGQDIDGDADNDYFGGSVSLNGASNVLAAI